MLVLSKSALKVFGELLPLTVSQWVEFERFPGPCGVVGVGAGPLCPGAVAPGPCEEGPCPGGRRRSSRVVSTYALPPLLYSWPGFFLAAAGTHFII